MELNFFKWISRVKFPSKWVTICQLRTAISQTGVSMFLPSSKWHMWLRRYVGDDLTSSLSLITTSVVNYFFSLLTSSAVNHCFWTTKRIFLTGSLRREVFHSFLCKLPLTQLQFISFDCLCLYCGWEIV